MRRRLLRCHGFGKLHFLRRGDLFCFKCIGLHELRRGALLVDFGCGFVREHVCLRELLHRSVDQLHGMCDGVRDWIFT